MLLKKMGVLTLDAILLSIGFVPRRQPAVIAQDTTPHTLINVDRMLDRLEDSTAIQPFSGWHNSASSGEGVESIQTHLDETTALAAMGMEIENQPFHSMYPLKYLRFWFNLTQFAVSHAKY